MTQLARVIKASRSYKGVTQADFLGETVDGGPNITRLAARIFDAEQAGYAFEVIGWRAKCKVYRLVSEPVSALTGASEATGVDDDSGPPFAVPVSAGQLFEVEPVRQGHYDNLGEAA